MTSRHRVIARLLLAGLLVSSAACNSSTPQAEPTPTMSQTVSPSETPTPSPQGIATNVVFEDREDLYVYDVAGNVVRPLFRNGSKNAEYSPIFTDAGTIAYASDRSVFEVDLASERKREIRKFPGEVGPIAWSPDRSTLAVLYRRPDPNDRGYTLRLDELRAGRSRDIRKFQPWNGRGGSDADEVRIEWSPDGTKIIVVITPLDTTSKKTMFVVDLEGKDVVPGRLATMARWVDSGSVVYRDFEDAGQSWHLLDLDSGNVRDLAMTRGTVRPALSPDRKLIAYDDGEGTPTIFVFDLAAGRERKLASGSLAVLWLANDSVAATVVKPCVPATDSRGSCVSEGSRVHQRKAVRIGLDGSSRSITLRDTFTAAAHYR